MALTLPLKDFILPIKKVERFDAQIKSDPSNSGVDIFVQVAADQRKAVWCSSVFISRARSTRAAGLSPRGGSLHTLLAIGLIQSLRSVNKGHANRLMGKSTQKPTVQILTTDENFAVAVQAFAADKRVEGFKAGKNFWLDLLKQIRRFNITVQVVPEGDPRIGVLRRWGVNTVYDVRQVADTPPVFQPSAVSVSG